METHVRAVRLRRWLLALLVVAAATVAGWATAATASADDYVSLGDSYVAGPFILNTIGSPYGCIRSDHNYQHLSAGGVGLPLRDPSCSGAKTTRRSSRRRATAAGRRCRSPSRTPRT